MRKPFLFIIAQISFFFSFAQQATSDFSNDLIAVQRGDSFFIRPGFLSAPKKPLLTNLLRALGASATAYGLSHNNETAKNINATKSVLPEIGMATFITAPKISGLLNRNKIYLQYFIYDKRMKLVETSIIPIDMDMLKRNNGNVPGIKITVPGFLKIELMIGKKTATAYKNMRIVVVPDEKIASEDDVPLKKIIPAVVPVKSMKEMYSRRLISATGL